MKLYHTDVFMPRRIWSQAIGEVQIEYSHHARQAMQDDRYGDIPSRTSLTIQRDNIIEVEMDGTCVNKLVVRHAIDYDRDMVTVLLKKFKQPWLVKTVWINLASDKHKTLNTTPYQKP